MLLIDLSREIHHRMQGFPTHPPVIIAPFTTHEDVRDTFGVDYSSATLALALGDHAGTHVDAPRHFDASAQACGIDEMPLEDFFTPAVCLDLSHVPMKADITIAHLEAAEEAAGIAIEPGDTVLLHTGFAARTLGTDAYLTDFQGLTRESARWLGERKITMFGVEAISPGRPGKNNFEVHNVCRDMGFTHIEGLVNLDKLVGKGRFRFIGFPLKIRGGTGSPIRAVAWLDG
ncbi:MAG: cyclase family protein [Methyloligellaceae bacterium]